MKGIIAILLLLMSFGFVAEKVLLAEHALELSLLHQQDGGTDAGEEKNGKGLEDLKETYCTSASVCIYLPAEAAILTGSCHLQYIPSGFPDKPYMPPEVI